MMASSSSSSEGIETALTTLQPIRDLAKNWDIDIAAWCVRYDIHDTGDGYHVLFVAEKMTLEFEFHTLFQCVDKNSLECVESTMVVLP
jgi:hypothetical protein